MNTIPPITDPLGRHWQQPDPAHIVVDDARALMCRSTFNRLLEYSSTIPTGVYHGKMWKANAAGVWMLRWFGDGGPTHCTNNQRKILIEEN